MAAGVLNGLAWQSLNRLRKRMIRSVPWSDSYDAARTTKAQVLVLQGLVYPGCTQTGTTTILFEDTMPAGKQSRKPTALAAKFYRHAQHPVSSDQKMPLYGGDFHSFRSRASIIGPTIGESDAEGGRRRTAKVSELSGADRVPPVTEPAARSGSCSVVGTGASLRS
jgi:hypothetical protein